MGTRSFPAVKRPGIRVDHPSSSIAEVKERVEANLCPPPPLCVIMSGYRVNLLPRHDGIQMCNDVSDWWQPETPSPIASPRVNTVRYKITSFRSAGAESKRTSIPATTNKTHTSACTVRYPTYPQRTTDLSTWESGRKSKGRKLKKISLPSPMPPHVLFWTSWSSLLGMAEV